MLQLPGLYLAPGQYEVRVQIPFTLFSDSMYISIHSPPLVVVIAGGSEVTFTHGDLATIDAYWKSYDPNYPRDASYLDFRFVWNDTDICSSFL